ncbi:MAG: redoxin family protein [Flavisolibacter sp.]
MKRIFYPQLFLFLFFSVALTIQGNTQGENNVQQADREEINRLKDAIEKNPNDLQAHEAYVKAVGFTKWGAPEDPEFVAQYESWMKKFPKSAAIAYALGHAYAGKESPKAKPFLLKAVAIDPKFDKAWFDLWIDAERWGDGELATSYLLKAKEANPENADYAFYYANSYSDTDYDKYKKLSLEVAKKYPATERGAQALYWLANRTKDVGVKTSVYEQQKKDFPAAQFSWTSSGMSEYFNVLLKTDAAKALTLAEQITTEKGKDARDFKTWERNIDLAKNIMLVQQYLKTGKATDAAAIMEKVAVPRYGASKEFILFLKAAAADAAGNTSDAYTSLLTAFVKEPAADVKAELLQYGKKLGKNEAAVNKEIWYSRDTAAKQAPVFNLENYFTSGLSSLNDYKGKVVLLTYWFPGCGPCRGEFPHFENVVKNFKDRKDFVYLGINIVPEQDDYVLPFMKSTGFSFIPLKDNDKWEKGPLNNRNAAPVNFLIDQDGKIIFSNFRTDGNNEATLEMMIRSMLARK